MSLISRRTFWAVISMTGISGETGRLAFVLASVNDITIAEQPVHATKKTLNYVRNNLLRHLSIGEDALQRPEARPLWT